jgi:AcrR family transcriptional regulator
MPQQSARPKLLPRAQRRQALLAAAARAFARGGFAATSLDDVAAEAGVSRVLIYRHFDSKEQLYRAILDQTRVLLAEATGAPDELGPSSLQALVRVAQDRPDEFRLFFRHAGREPDFRAHADWLRASMIETTMPYLRTLLSDERLRAWAGELVPTVAIEAILAWLEAGRPAPERAAETIGGVIGSVIDSISQADRADES